MSGAVYQLRGRQRDAVDPQDSVWLSAAAGTGKTQVLSARVLRLLLEPDNDPSQILCLTFTKAAAAEMANRVNAVLARWVRLDEKTLFEELEYLGAEPGPAARDRARSLFARVLDCPGGGLRIDTIHAFAGWLLSAFPEEAGIDPGMQPMGDRDRDLLARDVMAEMLVEAERAGEGWVRAAMAGLSRDKGVDAVGTWLQRCAAARPLWFGPGAWQPPFESRLRRLLGLADEASEADVTALCTDATFDVAALRRCLQAKRDRNTPMMTGRADSIEQWLALEGDARAAALDDLRDVFCSKSGPRKAKDMDERFPDYADDCAAVLASLAAIDDFRNRLALVDHIVPLLRLGRRFAFAWDERKRREGLVEFDDLIERAARLLQTAEERDWIRYKLDRRFDHVLIDEAQDTNAAQWAIIDALIDDFFSGAGAKDNKLRTVFTVGDYKQAIFGFQGTSPENFGQAKERVRAAMDGAADNLARLRSNREARGLRDYDLAQSYRTGAPVLEFVDRAIGAIGWQAMGLDRPPPPHEGLNLPGLVRLWNPVTVESAADDEDDGDEPAGWLPTHERAMADRLAEQVARWMADGFPLLKSGEPRRAGPGDVMVLVRERRELAGLIVARLHARGVPVAGVDRLRLGAPLAVRDLLAALRFAAQPLDDLSLACVLVSPLVGWTQEELLERGWRPPGARLWHHLRDSGDAATQATVERLRALLSRVDFELPSATLQWMLSGPWRGRAALVGRLGYEANDPIDELINTALAYEATHTPSLAGFLRWFDAGTGDVRREAEGAGTRFGS